MKFFTKLSAFFACMLVAMTAFGGSGAGGSGFGKTKLLLQSFAYDKAILALDGVTNIPDTDPTPRLVIPEKEYLDFLAEVDNEVKTGKPFVLPVDIEDGSGNVRCYILMNSGIGQEPLFMFLEVTECE